MSDFINKLANDLHNKHYEISKHGLILPDEQPNANIIYHLYNDGEVTYQKGGYAYKKRGEFNYLNKIYYEKSPFNFPIKGTNCSYAILTLQECINMREKMKEILNK